MPFPAGARLLFPVPTKRTSVLTRTDMETGPAKQAVTQSLQLVERTVRYRMSSAEYYDEFIDWYDNDIARGAQFFPWTDLDGADVQARMVKGEYREEQIAVAEQSEPDYEVEYVLEFYR